jgi:hypothetical protein
MNIEQLLDLVKKDATDKDFAVQINHNRTEQTLRVVLEDDDGACEYHVPDAIHFERQVEAEAGSEKPSALVDAFWAVLNDHYQL